MSKYLFVLMLSLLSSGSNAHGQLAHDSLDDSHIFGLCSFVGCAPGKLPSNTSRLLDIANGANHTLALLEVTADYNEQRTELWGCGDGRAGQLGPAWVAGACTMFTKIDLPLSQNGLSDFTLKSISASWETSYIVLSSQNQNDVLISMGANDFGDLGVGISNKGKGRKFNSFSVVNFNHIAINDIPLTTLPISITCVASGQHHVAACIQVSLAENETKHVVVGWGTARHGQLGTSIGSAPAFHSLPKIVLGPTVSAVAVALGAQHSVMVHTTGHLTSLGSNRKGQLHGLDSLDYVSRIGCTWNGTYALREHEGTRELFSTGSSSHGQLGRHISIATQSSDVCVISFTNIPEDNRIDSFACGSEHVLALFSIFTISGHTNEVWGWGWNEHGNLGIGTTDDVEIPVRIWPPANDDTSIGKAGKVIGVWAGAGTSWICYTSSA